MHPSLVWLYSFVTPHARQIVKLLLLSLLASGLVLAQPWLTKWLIDEGLLAGSFRTLVLAALAVFVSGIFSTGLAGLNRLLHTRLSGRILFALRESVYAHLQTLSPNFYIRQRTGDILSRLDGDIAEIQRFAVDGLFAGFSGVVGLAGAVLLMSLLSWQLTLVVLILVPLQWFYLRHMRPRVERQTRHLRERSSDISSFFAETLPAMKFIQAAAAEERELQQLRQLNRSFLEDLLKLQWIEFGTAAIPSTLTAGARLAAFVLGGYWVIQGQFGLGSLIAFSSYLGMATGPVQTLLGIYLGWQRMRVSLTRVQALTAMEAGQRTGSGKPVPPGLAGEIRFDRLSFRYPEEAEAVLEEATVCIPAGSKVGVYGPSGMGKTTLADLLLRHFQPDRGCIRIDGLDIAGLDLRDWRRHVAVVAQDVVLFRGSIADNVRYNRPEAKLPEVMQAVRAAGLEQFIAALPEGIDTAIGERGARLSGGERQRLAIARALLQQPVLVILDEATSAVDQETEQQVMDAVDRLFHGVTRIVISHRESPLLNADYLLTIRQGRLLLEPGKGVRLA